MSATLERVRAKLKATGKTQTEISDATGVSQTTISRLLSGTGGFPRISTIESLEKFADSLAKPKRKRRPVQEEAGAKL